MASRRSLTTTTAAAGAVLIALCFVPSASATVAHSAHPQVRTQTADRTGTRSRTLTQSQAQVPAAAPAAQDITPNLADTGAVDTTPYLVGGSGFLGVGAALLLVARRRAMLLG